MVTDESQEDESKAEIKQDNEQEIKESEKEVKNVKKEDDESSGDVEKKKSSKGTSNKFHSFFGKKLKCSAH